ncbi:MAG: hypothetical protein M3174_07170 [Actinomycetota bacterium]|nr:hypothetical protein [Actinomycetota bacterium]
MSGGGLDRSPEELGAAEVLAGHGCVFAADLRRTGQLRDDLPDDEVADIVWSMNAPEYWLLLVNERGWTPQRFREWRKARRRLTRLLLAR